MLFDLSGKRKRFVQVIYAGLALLIGGGLVLFGIGGSANGGLGDLLGIGGSGTSSSDPQFNAQIDRLQAQLQTNPNDEKALVTLARTQFLAAQSALETDDNGQPALTDEASTQFQAATATWEKYLTTKPKQPDDAVASLIFRAYVTQANFSNDPNLLQQNLDGAVATAQVVADARPSEGSYAQLASYAYLAGQTKTADAAAKKALTEAGKSNSASLESQFKSARKQGESIAKYIKSTAPGAQELANPLSGLGGTAPAPGTGASP